MKHYLQKQSRLMAITPSSRGFGFAVLDTPETLVEWRVKAVKGKNKNAEALVKVEKLIAHYLPDKLILQDLSVAGDRHSVRIKTLSQQIIALAAKRKVKVKLLSPEQVRRAFFGEAEGTKHDRAEILARRFPEELDDRLPPKRQAWMSEDPRMDTFDAVALAVVAGLKAADKTHPQGT